MQNTVSIASTNGILTVTTRNVAEDFEKEHSEVLKRIHGYDKNGQHVDGILDQMDSSVNTPQYFIPTEYKDSTGKANKEYLLTRDGFSLLVMGFTGAKALEWKLRYISAFNAMEEHIRKQQSEALKDLSPQLQVLINLETEQKLLRQEFKAATHKAIEAEHKVTEVREELQDMRDIITLDTRSWRKDTASLINKMASKAGGYEHIEPIRKESYKLLCDRLAVNLEIRLTNIRKEAAMNGATPAKLKKFNYLDAIEKDKRLIEGYVAIIKEMAVKYGIGGQIA